MKDLTYTKRYEANTEGTDWVVGDIHGMYNMLMDKLDEVGFDKTKDRLFCVGDMIDRGPDSAKCVDLLDRPWFFSVIGNHELMLLNNDYYVWMSNGGDWWMYEDANRKEELRNKILSNCSVMCEVDHITGKKFGIVHAETPELDWNSVQWDNHYTMETALWARTKVKDAILANVDKEDPFSIANIDMVFHGHTPTKQVIAHGNQMWIDTAACFEDGYLTVLKVDDYL